MNAIEKWKAVYNRNSLESPAFNPFFGNCSENMQNTNITFIMEQE